MFLKQAFILVLVLAACCSVAAQAESGKSKPRVFIEDRDSFEASSHTIGVADRDSAGLSSQSQAGVRREHTEEVKTLNKACPDVIITLRRDAADYIVVWDNKTSEQTKWGQHANEFSVYNRERDLIGSGATQRLSAAAKDICKLIQKQNTD